MEILIVEDDPDGQALFSHILKYLQISYEVVASAEEALTKLSNSGQSYRAIIIDLALPGKDGLELLADIKLPSGKPDILCIAVTAYHTSKVREEALQAGFDAYFPKPLDASFFAEELQNIL